MKKEKTADKSRPFKL